MKPSTGSIFLGLSMTGEDAVLRLVNVSDVTLCTFTTRLLVINIAAYADPCLVDFHPGSLRHLSLCVRWVLGCVGIWEEYLKSGLISLV
jgi:hypothetical protein